MYPSTKTKHQKRRPSYDNLATLRTISVGCSHDLAIYLTQDTLDHGLMSLLDFRLHHAFVSSTYGAPVIDRNRVPLRSGHLTTSRPLVPPWKMQHGPTSIASSAPRIACLCQYNGASFSGWERKPAIRTVQSTIENAIAQICGTLICTAAASKTDARTHAVGQVFHFDPPIVFANSRAWVKALNRRLPSDVLILEAECVPKSFHARKNAAWRRYRYSILTGSRNSVFLSPLVWHMYQKPLDATRMNEAAKRLKCQHPKDFSAFKKARSSAAHSNIIVYDISVHRAVCDPNLVEIEVCASWFLYGMMRLLTAALVDVGTGALEIEDFSDIFHQHQRHRVRHSAPASGLCLLEVGYSGHQNLFARPKVRKGCSPLTQGLSL